MDSRATKDATSVLTLLVWAGGKSVMCSSGNYSINEGSASWGLSMTNWREGTGVVFRQGSLRLGEASPLSQVPTD